MGCVISARARRDFGQRSTHMLRDGLSACQPAPQQRSTTDASGAFADRVVIDRKAGQAHYRCASRARCARNGKRPAGYQKAASPSSVRLACTGYRCCRYRRPTATGSDRAQSFAQQHAGIVMEVPTHRPRVRALVQRIPPVVFPEDCAASNLGTLFGAPQTFAQSGAISATLSTARVLRCSDRLKNGAESRRFQRRTLPAFKTCDGTRLRGARSSPPRTRLRVNCPVQREFSGIIPLFGIR